MSEHVSNDQPTGPPTIPDHQLLRRIGRGSYGEVWLARGNATGALRAIKIVHRASFDNDTPYEREFTGLKNVEPLSRAHEGLVDILQVSRNDAVGCFYYVMELADDANARCQMPDTGRPPDAQPESGGIPSPAPAPQLPAAYRPLTLESRIRAEGRLPVKECVRVASTLVDALRFLHDAGLVHRDLKPSNIIFVGGVPKLADVGLVAHAGSARTFVGTEGFIPPEGPGTPHADIYSLGKCLYEMATGKDRQAFPSPPTLLDGLPDRDALLELNEVITKACEPNPDQRYRSAAAMGEDLRLIAAGISLTRTRRLHRFRRAALAAGATLAAVGLGWLGVALLRNLQPQVGRELEVVRAPGVAGDLIVTNHEFSLPGNSPAFSAKLGNFDGGPDLELFHAADGKLYVLSLEGNLLRERRVAGDSTDWFGLGLIADADGDGQDEALVSWRQDTNLVLRVFNQNFMPIHRYAAMGSRRPTRSEPMPDSELRVLRFLPAEPGQPPLLLTFVTSGYGVWPRAARCYNYTNETLLWEVPLASLPSDEMAVVRDSSGTNLFILGSSSLCNQARLDDGMDDDHTYLYALSTQGLRQWIVETGPHHARTLPQVATAQGSNAIFALVCRDYEQRLHAGEPTNPWSPSVLKFDPDGRELARFTTKRPLNSLLVADLDGSGLPVALVATGDGALLVLDANLQLLREVPIVAQAFNWVDLRIVAVSDLDRDGRAEVILSARQMQFVSGENPGRLEEKANVRHWHDNSVVILDQNFRRRFQQVIHPGEKLPYFVVRVASNAAGETLVLALHQNVSVLRFRRR